MGTEPELTFHRARSRSVGGASAVPLTVAVELMALGSTATLIITNGMRGGRVLPLTDIIGEPVAGRNQRCVVKLLRRGHRDAEMRASRANVLVEPLHRLG